MEVRNDGFQIEIAEIPEIVYKNLVYFLFKVRHSMPLSLIDQSKT
jgi:hypothetical protein